MVKRYFILWLAIGYIFVRCMPTHKQENELTFEKIPYSGNELRVSGYYYMEPVLTSGNVPVYFFFRNGILMTPGDYDPKEFTTMEKNLTEQTFKEKYKTIEWAWGLFHIRNDSIFFEKWYPSFGPYEVGIRSGKIVNDSTFIITHYRKKEGELKVYEHLEVYHFREYHPKPDSTTSLIK